MSKDTDIKITSEKMKEGILISLKKSTEHLDSAEILVNNNFLNDAVALVEFAFEEFGRAVYLRERIQKGLKTIERSLKRDHRLKYDKAFSVLPEHLKTIWEKIVGGWFPKGYFPKGYHHEEYWGASVKKEIISHDTRLNAIFVNYDKETQTWQNGINVDGDKLKIIVDTMREYIENFV